MIYIHIFVICHFLLVVICPWVPCIYTVYIYVHIVYTKITMIRVMCSASRGYVICRKNEVRRVFGHGFVNPPCPLNRPIVFEDIESAKHFKHVLDVAVSTTGVWEDAIDMKNGELSIAENIRLSVEMAYVDMEYCDIRGAREDEVTRGMQGIQ